MGRHTMSLSDDWSACTKCNMKLDHGVCNCCGCGFSHVCSICMQTKKGKNSKPWNMALGDNVGCDEHLQIDDVFFPPEYPKCEHIIAEEKAKEAGW